MGVIRVSRARSLAGVPALSLIPAGSALIWLGGQGPRGYPPARYGRYRGQVPARVVMRLIDGPVLLVNHIFPSGPVSRAKKVPHWP